MSFKYTSDTLKKIERIFKDLGYVIRYERGNFHAGYCILEKKKVVVINKFYDTESRINSLVEIINLLKYNPALLSEESMTWGRKAFGPDFASHEFVEEAANPESGDEAVDSEDLPAESPEAEAQVESEDESAEESATAQSPTS
jgi:hypothetical protein